MHAQDDMGDSSTDDDAASQTTEDDPQVPEHQEASAPLPPLPVNPNPISSLASRERPHYELRHTIRGHTMSISAVKFSPDGTLLASSGPYCFTCLPPVISTCQINPLSGAENVVKIWSPFTGELVRNLNGHTKGLSDIAWSSDSIYLASASDDTTIRIWEVDTVCYDLSNTPCFDYNYS